MLHPYPSLRARADSPSRTPKVDKLSRIRQSSARYSVPNRFIGATFTLMHDGKRLLINAPECSDVIAEHVLPPAKSFTLMVTAAGHVSLPAECHGPKPVAEKQFCALGESVELFLVGAAAIGDTRLACELDDVLGLVTTHGTEKVIAALTRAVAFRRIKAAYGRRAHRSPRI